MKINKNIIEKTRRYAKEIYKKTDRFHSWDSHINFVVQHAKIIAKNEGMDVGIAEMGALLHDIARKEYKSGDHDMASAKKAEIFLKPLGLDKDIIFRIKEAIAYHSEDIIKSYKTREALAVHDADKLDRIGPRGFLRNVLVATRYTHPEFEIDQLFEKSVNAEKRNILRMQTKTGKQLAKKYYAYTREFIRGYYLIKKK